MTKRTYNILIDFKDGHEGTFCVPLLSNDGFDIGVFYVEGWAENNWTRSYYPLDSIEQIKVDMKETEVLAEKIE